ncbi:hypothetical protein D7Z26_27060 [Cohnella endophytica]|uniref:DUF927 domain-containing protein n=1 Tax=Cohnella endophytica TaxID=2419778 RepID=A0A494WZE6_9BACL|nr:hypothetical protein [Cohnella endophytica]RKP43908.1 hypothetical protein D7Z26_27060 [Cohnella endophytica]
MDVEDIINEAEQEEAALIAQAGSERFVANKGIYVQVNFNSNGVRLDPITNFVFDNTRFVSGDRGLLADVRVNGKLVKSSTFFDKTSLTTVDAFRKKLPTEADLLVDQKQFSKFVKFLKAPARSQPHVNMIDQTGLYKDAKTCEYYFVIYDTQEKLQQIVKTDSKITSTVYCEGVYAPKTKSYVRLDSTEEKFKNTARTLLNEVPEVLKDNKSTITLAWSFASLLSQLYYENKLYFPILFKYGEPGGGKSTLAKIIAAMLGYKSASDAIAFISTAQPLKMALAATNAFVVVSEEFVLVKNKEAQPIAILKLVYNRDKVERGETNKQNSVSQLSAPLIIQGNTYVTNEAVADRCLPVHVRKADRAMKQAAVAKLLRADFSHFLYPYLLYLIERQDKWHEWFTRAEEIVGRTDGDQRAYNAASAVVFGILMMNDLAEHVGANQISPETINKIIESIMEQRSISNPEEPYIRFIKFVQDKHTDENVSKEKQTLLDGKRFWLSKTYWVEKFLEDVKSKGQEAGQNDLLASLAEQPFVEGGKEGIVKHIYQKTVRAIGIDIEALAKQVPEIRAELWNDIRLTNSRLEAEYMAKDLKGSVEHESGKEEGKKEVLGKLEQLKAWLNEDQLKAFKRQGFYND